MARQFALITSRQARAAGITAQSVGRRVAVRRMDPRAPARRVPPRPPRSRCATVGARARALGGCRRSLALTHDDGRPARLPPPSTAVGERARGLDSRAASAGSKQPLCTRAPRHAARPSRSHRSSTASRSPRPVRTLIDLSGRLEDHQLLALTEDLFLRGIVREDRLRARLAALRSSGRPGAGRLEALLDQRGDGRPLESALETLVWQIIVATAGAPARTPVLGDRRRLCATDSTSRGPT